MALNRPGKLLDSLRNAVLPRTDLPSDAELLRAYLGLRDEAAFAALVRRHGGLVWGVCRRVAGSHHDAEDAFQAAFMVLARKAASVRAHMLANWLYGVAHNVALKAKAMTAKRRVREMPLGDLPHPAAAKAGPRHDLEALLDQELARLPHKYRAAIVLCDLEEMSRKEAACQLKIPEGTLSSRLTVARNMLAKRLARSGVAISGATLAATLAQSAAEATVPAQLIPSTIQAASLFAAKQATDAALSVAAVLAREEIHAMLLTKLKNVLTVLFVAGLFIGLGAAELARRAAAQGETSTVHAAGLEAVRAEAPSDKGKVKTVEEILEQLGKRGAQVYRDDKAPGRPVIKIDLNTLFGTRASDTDIPVVTQIDTLEDLQIGGGRITDAALEQLAALKSLRVLNLGGTKITDDGLKSLARMPRLEEAWLAGTKISNDGLKHLKVARSLRHVGLFNTAIGDDAAETLSSFPDLAEVHLGLTKMTDKGLKHLAKLPKLKSLWLGDTAISDEGVKALRGAAHLRLLYLNGTPVSDAALKDLATIESLEILNLAATKVTDAGIRELAPLKKLRYLNLMLTKVSDASLEAIGGLQDLEELRLHGAAVSDRGILALSRLERLHILDVSGTAVTEEGAAKLKEKLPKCNVLVR